MLKEITVAIQELVRKAEKSDNANDALKYSQAACNVANSFCAFVSAKELPAAFN